MELSSTKPSSAFRLKKASAQHGFGHSGVAGMISLITAISLLGAACSGSSDDSGASDTSGGSDTTNTSAATTTDAVITTTVATTSTAPPESTTSTTEPASAIDLEGDKVLIEWENLSSEPFYAAPAGGDDPFYHIHTNPDVDGFFLSFELFTTGYGSEWTGETGTFDISCASATASTGICPYFDPDGPGPLEVLGTDFDATGSMTIVRLDGAGYELVVHDLVFGDGTSFEEFTVVG